MSYARSIIPQQAGNNIGVGTNNKALTLSAKVLRKIVDPSSGMIRFTSLDFFSGTQRVCSFLPDADYEVPIVTYVDYWCTRVCEESQIVTLVADDGTIKEDIRTGLKLGRKVIVTVASAMGDKEIHILENVRMPEKFSDRWFLVVCLVLPIMTYNIQLDGLCNNGKLEKALAQIMD
ncbi:unnamed protein product [Arabis nemorensis]|uniref:Uncharacterized protein n=1 Tax=Arabis nemorensis TaxID=586526 RepID=A0A565ALT6_9BRAS|nr:unnamed protein product [Arabis nemorensis]